MFAVEHDSVQLCWAGLPSGPAVLEVAGRSFDVGATPPGWYRRWGGRRPAVGAAGPGSIVVDGLEPSTDYEAGLSVAGIAGTRTACRFRTLEAPPGRLLSKFATISDCHFGERTFGPLRRLHDPSPKPADLVPYTVRCAAAAIAEAEAWGAATVVAKGDLTQNGKAAEVALALDVLRTASVPVVVALGNHDVRGPIDAASALTAGGFPATENATHVDLPGLRVVLGHSPIPHRHGGRLPPSHISEIASLAAGASEIGLPVVVVLHHPLRRFPVETHYPPSVNRRDTLQLGRALTRVGNPALVISGHTHRNRLYRVASLPAAEVGSTKDYPGQWAGYAVYEGGIRQVVRRVAAPEAFAWNEMTRRALGGLWGAWSPGRLGDRCWTLHWDGGRIVRAS